MSEKEGLEDCSPIAESTTHADDSGSDNDSDPSSSGESSPVSPSNTNANANNTTSGDGDVLSAPDAATTDKITCVCVLGAGSFGTAIASMLARNNIEVTILDRNEARVKVRQILDLTTMTH